MRTVLALLLLAVSCRAEGPFVPRAECNADTDCSDGRSCLSGTCVAPALEGCDPGRTRCVAGSFVETCVEDGSAWERDALPCVGGCDYDRCVGRACVPYDLRCVGQTLLICTNDGTRLVLYDQCPEACGVVDGEAQCTPG